MASYTKPHYINVYNNKTADTFTLHSDLDVVFSNFGKISYEDFYYQLLMEESPIETQKVDKKDEVKYKRTYFIHGVPYEKEKFLEELEYRKIMLGKT